jgi:hypothetical protein
MVEFFTTPIFFLTPWIMLWSILTGIIAALLAVRVFRPLPWRQAWIAAAVTALASMLWNWSIAFNGATTMLNVDHPQLRISWADALNGICVLACTALVLGLGSGRNEPARRIVGIAVLAAAITILNDTFFF